MGIFDIFKATDTAFFPGCITYHKYKDGFELYQKIFSRLRIDFKVLDKQICSGVDALEAGYENEARKLARKNLDLFKKEEIKSIITNSPAAYKAFSHDYKDLLPDWNIEIKNIWQIILNRLKEKPSLIKHHAMKPIIFHDSCYLGRYSGIYNEPREILEIIGYEVKEFSYNKEKSMCCGSCGGLPRVNPKLADEIAKERVLQAKRLGADKIIVCDFQNYELLKKNSQEFGIKVVELSDVLGVALGIKMPEPDSFSKEEILLNVKSNMAIEDELKEEDLYEAIKSD